MAPGAAVPFPSTWVPDGAEDGFPHHLYSSEEDRTPPPPPQNHLAATHTTAGSTAIQEKSPSSSIILSFIDQCAAHNVPDDIVADHVYFMVQAMQRDVKASEAWEALQQQHLAWLASYEQQTQHRVASHMPERPEETPSEAVRRKPVGLPPQHQHHVDVPPPPCRPLFPSSSASYAAHWHRKEDEEEDDEKGRRERDAFRAIPSRCTTSSAKAALHRDSSASESPLRLIYGNQSHHHHQPDDQYGYRSSSTGKTRQRAATPSASYSSSRFSRPARGWDVMVNPEEEGSEYEMDVHHPTQHTPHFTFASTRFGSRTGELQQRTMRTAGGDATLYRPSTEGLTSYSSWRQHGLVAGVNSTSPSSARYPPSGTDPHHPPRGTTSRHMTFSWRSAVAERKYDREAHEQPQQRASPAASQASLANVDPSSSSPQQPQSQSPSAAAPVTSHFTSERRRSSPRRPSQPPPVEATSPALELFLQQVERGLKSTDRVVASLKRHERSGSHLEELCGSSSASSSCSE